MLLLVSLPSCGFHCNFRSQLALPPHIFFAPPPPSLFSLLMPFFRRLNRRADRRLPSVSLSFRGSWNRADSRLYNWKSSRQTFVMREGRGRPLLGVGASRPRCSCSLYRPRLRVLFSVDVWNTHICCDLTRIVPILRNTHCLNCSNLCGIHPVVSQYM